MQECFYPKNIFNDCKCDDLTVLGEPLKAYSRNPNTSLNLDSKHYAEIYKSFKDAYAAGGVLDRSRQYYFKQRQAETRYNSRNVSEKVGGYFLENVAGYGIKPFRVLVAMILLFLLGFAAFHLLGKIGISDSLFITAGAMFTFGANVNQVNELGIGFHILYVLISFFGIALSALLITVLANIWFKDR